MKEQNKVFINLSNHPSKNWSKEQIRCALDLVPEAKIIDVGFPAVDSTASENDIYTLAVKITKDISEYSPSVVMCQGEFGLTYCVVNLLKELGIKAVYGCSERKTIERQTENGIEKTSVFQFVKFRYY